MNHLQGVTVYIWSMNHIALKISKNQYSFNNGAFTPDIDGDNNPVRSEKFRGFTHNSNTKDVCNSSLAPETVADVINTFFENKRAKKPSLIRDFWEDCAQYIRDDQVEMLKSLYQLMLEHYAFDDDEDLEDLEEYDDNEEDENILTLKSLGMDIKLGNERRNEALTNADQHTHLQPLVKLLCEDKPPLEKKYILINFAEKLKEEKGLALNPSDDAYEEVNMFVKLPINEWTIPLGNSLMDDPNNRSFVDNLNLFGLNARGMEIGMRRFSDPNALIHNDNKSVYYKFFSRYHNCAGYSRFLLEQGGITAFCSSNELERYGVTDSEKYNDYLIKVNQILSELNQKSRELIKNSKISPLPLERLDNNYLSDFKQKNAVFKTLPGNIRNLLDAYNAELVEVSYEHKINLLMQMVNELHKTSCTNRELIDALQKETRRNAEIDFDAQFSHNNYFKLQVLAAFAGIGIATYSVGILSIAFSPLIPVILAASITLTLVGAITAVVSLGIFAKHIEPRRPNKESLINIQNTMIEEFDDGYLDSDSEMTPLDEHSHLI